MQHLIQTLSALHSEHKPYVLVTLTQIRGSAPQVEGAKMVVTSEGWHWGTIGGGKIEARAIEIAKTFLSEDQKSQARTFNLQKDIGMSCGGEVTVFFDVQNKLSWSVAIFGAGHVAQELLRVMTTWSCHIQVFDTRPEWLELLPTSHTIDKKCSRDLVSEVTNLPEDCFLFSITQGHAVDVPILAAALKREKPFRAVGVIGSEVKAKKIRAELLALGLSEERVRELICPLGLPLGANTPAEIAISIAAQLLALRDQVSFKVERGNYDQYTHLRS